MPKRKIWYLADTHINHDHDAILSQRSKIAGSNTKLPEPHISNIIIDNINRVVKKDDVIIALGDMVFGNKHELLWDRITCKNVILVSGNHDKQPGHGPYLYKTYRLVRRIAGQRVIISHYPPKHPVLLRYGRAFLKILRYWSRFKRVYWKSLFPKYIKRFPQDDGTSFYLHGHTHQMDMIRGRAICVCVDATKLKPVSEDELAAIIQRQSAKIQKSFKYKFFSKVFSRFADKKKDNGIEDNIR